jgi:HlyD family secretion protein
MATAALPSLDELHEALGPARGALRSRLPWLLGGLALAVVLGAGLVYAIKGKHPTIQYLSTPVLRGDLAVTVASTGTLEAVTSVEVGSEVSGRVLREFVDVNDQVKKGQVMAEIDPEPLNSSLTQAQAQLRGARDAIHQAQATATESERTLTRNRALSQDGILAQADLDASRSARDRDHASLNSAQENARVANANQDLASSKRQKATIRAPIDGVVLARLVEQGQTVTAGFQTPVLFKLAQDLSKMRLNVDIDEADVSRIRAGEAAVFTVEAYPGRNFPSAVVSLQMQPKISQNVVTYLAVLSVDNLDRALLPGMTCTATIQAETRRAVLMVPNAALRFQPPAQPKGGPSLTDGKHRVWVLKGKTPEAVEVNLGATDGRNTEILSGALQEGMNVLTDTKTTP